MTSGTRTGYLDINGLQRPRFRDINDSGVITGLVGNQAFVGTPGNWCVFAAPGVDETMGGNGLNNAGVLVGWTFDSVDETFSGWNSSPVPEPATWALTALDVAVLAWRASRRGA